MKLLITADWHLREDLPVCRAGMSLEDWWELQKSAIQFVFKTAWKYPGAKVAMIGDTFDRSHVHPAIVNMLLSVILGSGVDAHLLAGNHELPYHQLKNMHRASFGNLWQIATAGETNLKTMDTLGKWFHFGTVNESEYSGEEFVFLHELCFKDEKDKPPVDAYIAGDLLDMFPQAKYICLGDNHRHFIYSEDSRYVINPGCLIRQAADLMEDRVGFYLLDTDTENVEFIPFDDGEITDLHLEKERERDDRIEAFVSSIDTGGRVTLDFMKNLKREVRAHGAELGTAVDIVHELMEECNES